MKRWVKWSMVGTGIVLVVSVVAAGLFMRKAGPIGSGFVSKYLCSSTFISHRDPEVVFREDVVPVNPLAPFFDYRIDYENKSVTADAHGLFGMTAIYREGCGCSLVIGTTEAAMRKQTFVPPDFSATRPVRPSDLPWPDGSGGPEDPAALGINVEKLDAALKDAFREPWPGNPRKTRAVVVIYDGKLVAERYADGVHKDMPLLGWSMAKSITNALVGILVKDGRLDIRKPAPVPEWQAANDPRKAITLDELLRMSSGLSFEEVYKPLYDATDMLYGSYDFAAFAAVNNWRRRRTANGLTRAARPISSRGSYVKPLKRTPLTITGLSTTGSLTESACSVPSWSRIRRGPSWALPTATPPPGTGRASAFCT